MEPIPVDDVDARLHDARLHKRRRQGYRLDPEVQGRRLAAVLRGEREPVDRPEDCSKPCWRHVDGGGQCECEESEIGTTSDPAGW